MTAFLFDSVFCLAVLGLHCCEGSLWLLGAGLLCVGSTVPRVHGLQEHVGLGVVAGGPSCSVARGIFLDQESNPCLLRGQVDSYPLYHQGSLFDKLFVSSPPLSTAP